MAVPSLLELEEQKDTPVSEIPSLDQLESQKKNPNASISSPSVSESGTSVSTDGVSEPPKYEYKWTPTPQKEIPVELAPTYTKTPTGKSDVLVQPKTVKEVKKEGKEPSLENYIATIGKATAEHVGGFLQEGMEGIGAGGKRLEEGLMMTGGILPQGEVFEKMSKGEYGDNVAVKGFVKSLAGAGEAAFAAAMHFTPHGAVLTEATKVLESTGLDEAIPQIISPGVSEVYKQKTGTDIKLTQLLFAPVSSIATTAKGDALVGSEEDLALIGDFLAGAAIFGFSKKGYTEGRDAIVKKINEGAELNAAEMKEVVETVTETIADKEAVKNIAEQKGLKLKEDEAIQKSIDEKDALTDKAKEEILANPDEFIGKINENKDLLPQQKKIAIDNINKLVAKNDPRHEEAKKIDGEIETLKQKEKAIQDNTELSDNMKMAQSVVIQKEIVEKQKELIELFKKKEVPTKEINKDINKPKTEKDAIQKRSTEEIPVVETPKVGEKVVEGIPKPEELAGAQKPVQETNVHEVKKEEIIPLKKAGSGGVGLEGVAYTAEVGGAKSKGIYLADEGVAKSYGEEGAPIVKYKYKLKKPLVIEKDSDFDIVKKIIDDYDKKNPGAKFHPNTTDHVNKELEKLGYDGLIIKKEALDTEKGYNEIGGTYGDPQIVVFDRKNISKETTKAVSGGVVDVREIAKGIAKDIGGSVVGSASKEGTTPKDIDIRVDENFDRDATDKKMEALGYESRGSSLVSPEEAKASGKEYADGWQRANHYENKEGQKIDIWHDEPTEQSLKETPKAEIPNEQTKTETTAEAVLPVETKKAAVFSSPNIKEDLTFEKASENLKTPEHKVASDVTNEMYEKLGLESKQNSGIGDWEDGAENSHVTELKNVPDFETVKYAAALEGEMKNQKATIPFMEDKTGNDALFIIKSKESMPDLRKKLSDAGIKFRTLVPEEGGTKIIIFDKNRDNAKIIVKFAQDNGYKLDTHRGTGEFFGTESREQSGEYFRNFIQQYELGRIGETPLSKLFNRQEYEKRIRDLGAESTAKAEVTPLVSESKYGPRLKALEDEIAVIDAERIAKNNPKLRELTYATLAKERDSLLEKQKTESAEKPAEGKQYFKVGKSPQRWEFVRKEPFNPETDIKGEEFYTVKNEKTGEEQIVAREDLIPIKGKEVIEEGEAKELAQDIRKSLPEKKKKIDAKIKEPIKINPIDDSKNIIKAKLFPLKELLQAVNKPLNKIQDAVFGKYVTRAENWIAQQAQKALTSGNKTKQWTAQFFTNWANGLPRTIEEAAQKRTMKGKIALAYEDFGVALKKLHELVGNDAKSLERIHRVMDADFYIEKGETPLKYEDLGAMEKELHDILRSMNDYVHDYNYSMDFFNESIYVKNKGKYIPRMYEAFEIPEDAQKYLDEGAFTKNNKLNLKIFEARKELDGFMKENILKDPVYSTLKRMMQTEVNGAITEYIGKISENKNLVSEEAKAGFTQLNGRAYGKLDGKYVPNYIAEDFRGYFFSRPIVDMMYDVSKMYDRNMVRQFLKKYHTVFSPTVQLGNASANIVFAGLAGIDPVSFVSKVGDAHKEIKSRGKTYRMLAENGILGSDILTTDIVPLVEKTKPILSKTDEAGKSILDRAKRVDKALTDTYSNTDNVSKMAAFLALKESGMKDAEAMQRVYESFQNYSTVGKIWDFASKIPVVGNPFVKFQADLQRIIKNSVTKRPLTTAMYLATLNGIANLASNWSDETAEEKEIREGRRNIPKIKLPDFLGGDIPLIFQTPHGEVNLARYISPYYIYDLGDQGSPIDNFSKLLPLQLKTGEGSGKGTDEMYIAKQDPLLGVWWSAIFDDKDFRGISIKDPSATRYKSSGATSTEKTLNAINYIARSQVPYYSNVRDMVDAFTYGTDFYGRDRNPVQSVLNNFVKIQQFGGDQYKKVIENDLNSIQYKITALEGTIKDANMSIDKEIEKYTKKNEEGSINEAQLKNKVDELEATREKRMSEKVDQIAELQQKWEDVIVKYENILKPNLKGK